MDGLDAVNVFAHKLLQKGQETGYWDIDPEIEAVHFTGFKPSQTSFEMAGQLWGYVPEDGWYYVNVVIQAEDVYPVTKNISAIDMLIRDKLRIAAKELNELAGDSFGRWVKKVRKEEGVGK